MKIIENNLKSDFPRRVICRMVEDKYGYTYGDKNDFCGSILEIEASDIKKHPWEKYMAGDSGVDYGVVCPVCGKFIMLDVDTLNAQVKQEAPVVRLLEEDLLTFGISKKTKDSYALLKNKYFSDVSSIDYTEVLKLGFHTAGLKLIR